ncbi:TPA: T9SS type A sorting domain-containing protein [Candidatus Poribacteria bacterium]|nr:T9SS type A sorting domain-containing protein [Candidatus Poribacteria bacterium]
MDPPSRLYSVIRLYDASKRQIAYDAYKWWPCYCDPQILHTLPRDGIYYIRIEDYFYTLRLTGDIHDVTVSNRTHDSVTISWWTHGKIPVTGVVNYGTTTELGSTATDDNLRENGIHYVNITELTADTQYFFEVVSGLDTDDNNGQYYAFMTAKVPEDPPDTYSVFGYVYKDPSRTTPAPYVIKYFWLKHAGGESSLLSALTNAKGYWLGDLGKAKSDETNDVFPFAAGGSIYAYAHFGKQGKIWTSRYTVSGVSPQQLGDEALAVELTSFTAGVTVDGVILNWRTISEINNLGFNIYRSNAKDGKYTKVNARLIQGVGTDATPHDYSFTDENVKVGQTYYYYIGDVDFTGKTSKSDIIEVTVGKQRIKVRPVPPTFALLQNYPNPFNPETWIPFKLAQNANVVIRIYNTKGHLVRTITLSNREAGTYVTKDKAAYWDGTNSFGEKVGLGLYFYTIQAGEFRATKKMAILK